MKKIPTLFERDWNGDRRYVLPEVTAGCEWVIADEGTPTRKYDGTCMMYDGERWWARREVKAGKTPPYGWVQVDLDEETGKAVGWEPAEQSAFAKYLSEAIPGDLNRFTFPPGTYELIGPKVNGNPEGREAHLLVFHGHADRLIAPRDFDGLAKWLHEQPYEGIVWHHPDGRMAKIKKRDFKTPVAPGAQGAGSGPRGASFSNGPAGPKWEAGVPKPVTHWDFTEGRPYE